MLPYPTILLVSIVGVVMASIFVFIGTGSIMSVLVVLTLAGILFYLLQQFGVISVDVKDTGIDISYRETPSSPAPSTGKPKTVQPIEKKEVFYVSGNDYTYDEAPALCAAYEADLASYDQVMEAYSGGAEWCGYGWTQGGMALYPTQQATWEALQQETDQSKRTGCGRPGVNGGYFDSSTKFGVNCYGVKPDNKGIKLPLPLPGTDTTQFNNMVNKFRSMLGKITLSPFNRDVWSEMKLSMSNANEHPKLSAGHTSK
jgi:hypothetical protein